VTNDDLLLVIQRLENRLDEQQRQWDLEKKRWDLEKERRDLEKERWEEEKRALEKRVLELEVKKKKRIGVDKVFSAILVRFNKLPLYTDESPPPYSRS
jgi:hypothetical protein